ncbi:ABC transporter ATP-binding protein [Streptomyces lunaelactis]|uniref:ABC transporter ATP-binding protein n=2 Tax=Streptomyces lunaelactis TaxID=1535768 RepID=UPI001585B055|nr:ABC transporter ATP-binding protein [Streptomyces lunaelactis]NUK01635.1 ABC transporter ATP-binding protein [Streptomyces lunaelactis]NUK22597.1 ABC transporter ATP-binding protein [Streptomyces lunaelactis]NUK33222.1 ABC transporter ATP-binding protein [Streptomyces lunaelactis]NUK49071.1 ABC transporter ATP-binding protein [Streptomyces lunaelactis]NUK78132.1 ABC transporter ATP-binding protein [Streptomyces lunaelactis]
MTVAAIEARGLGRTYGRRRRPALRECSFRVPTGRVCALVGPNGAGKSTLLALAAGLQRPSEGALRVLGTNPASLREKFAYVAQDKPLYPQLTIGATLRLGHELNPGRWDAAIAERVVAEGDLDHDTRVRSLSGGQRTRVALALALGKRAELMLLDEPMADLDPLARHRLMGTLMAEAAEHGTTVVISSHVLTELETTCDYVLLVDGGRIRLAGETEDLLTAHTLITGPVADLDPHIVVESRTTGRQLTALVRGSGAVSGVWQTDRPSLEEVLMAHLRSPGAPALLTPSAEVAAA